MTEPEPTYTTPTDTAVATLLEQWNTGEIKRTRLPARLGLAFASSDDGGLLTISRSTEFNEPSGDEVRRVLESFRRAADGVGRHVLLFKEISREIVELEVGRYHVVRFSVYFGEQGRLFLE